MGDVLDLDLISNLPPSIIERILVQLPIRDVVRTSMLSRTWRYKWVSISNLVFHEKFVPDESLVKVITMLLLLHQGPIHKFQITNLNLQNCPQIDKWILYLSRNEIKELILELGAGEFYRAPSCLFNCKKLTHLDLSRCELVPPPSFKGFMRLKCLTLDQVFISRDAIQSLISNCPILEGLSLSYFDSPALTIRAPNLKYLYLGGEFKDICLDDTPLLVEIYLAMYMTDDIADHFEQSSVKFLGGVPNLEKLVGLIDFTKVPFCCYLLFYSYRVFCFDV